jgi:hypothetical protein
MKQNGSTDAGAWRMIGGASAHQERAFVSGQWYDNRYTAMPATTQLSIVSGRTEYMPVWIGQPLSVNALAVYLGASVQSGCKLGLLAGTATATGSPRPGVLLGQNSLPTVTVGAVIVTIPAVAVPLGWNFLAVSNGSGASISSIYGVPTAAFRPLWGATVPTTGTGALTAQTTGGAALASNPPVTTVAINTVPVVWFKAA